MVEAFRQVVAADGSLEPRSNGRSHTYYESIDPDESAGIWRVPAAGGEPQNIMPPLAGENGETQSVSDLKYTRDGQYLWFGHSTSFGGGTIARVADSGGEGEFFLATNSGCAGVAAPSPSLLGDGVVAARHSCTDAALEGLVGFTVPPSDAGQLVLAEGNSYDQPSMAPHWLADGSGLVYAIGGLRIDTDGDGLHDAQGDGIAILDFASGQSFDVVPVAANQRIDAFAVSPDEARVGMCMGTNTVSDLVLLDMSSGTAQYYTPTNDGESCKVAW